jgi:hypothetical protein
MVAALSAGDPAFAQATGNPGNAFNPSIGLILQGSFAEIDEDYPAIGQPGLLAGGESAEGLDEGFALDESELFLSANVDDIFYGEATVALHEGEAEVEEAFFRTLALPQGLSLQAGQFLSGVGYQNARHAHAWDFIDQPLAYDVLLGGQYKDPGVQLTWIAPAALFVQLGAEAMRGENFPAAGPDRDGKGVKTLFARVGGDVSASHSWQASVGNLHYDATGRETVTAGAPIDFSGSGDVSIVGLVWKWSPLGNWHAKNAVFQAEYLHRDEEGEVVHGADGGRYDGKQDGWYVQGVYQWKPRWRAGLRYDSLHADNAVQGLGDPGELLPAADQPRRISAMLDYSNSEFSRIRVQVNRARGAEGEGTALFLQYIMSLGAHGAHTF